MGEIRFVGTGETRGYPYLVCKKVFSQPISACEQTHKTESVVFISLVGSLFIQTSLYSFRIFSPQT